MTVRKFLDVSTSNLSELTCATLGSIEGVSADETRYGWLMHASNGAAQYAREHDWPAELLPIVELARSKGCEYILFDRDAEPIEGLPTFDW
jgi:hypothetical protein